MNHLTDRQQEVKSRLDKGMGAREIAEDLGITRNAVYQQIQRLRRDGVVPPDYTPTGLPMRERQGGDALTRLLTDDTNGEHAGTLALVQELRRTRDELNTITRRLTSILG